MTDTDHATPDDEIESRLRHHVGDAVFERGAAYFKKGRVGALSISGPRTRATVNGTQSYRVEVRHTPRGFEGECTCPASDGFDFCKHCVAVALAVDAHHAKRERAVAGAPIDRVHLYLEQLPREELIKLVAEAAGQQPDLQARLQLRSDAATGALDLRALRKMVTAAMPLRDIWQRAKVRAYFARAVSAISGLLDVTETVAPDDLLAVSVYAIDRLNTVLERVDDSDGNRWFLQDRVRALHAAALRRYEGTPAERAELLLTQVLRDPFDLYGDSVEDYHEALGEDGVKALYSAARQRLDAARPGDKDDRAHVSILRRLLYRQAEVAGDVDTLIELTRQDCNGAFDYYRLTELYLQKPDLDAAKKALDHGDALANDYSRNDELRVAVHRAREEWPQAVDAQLRVLAAQPKLEAHRTLMALAEQARNVSSTERAAHRALTAQLDAGHAGRNDAARLLAQLAHEAGDRDRAFELIVSHVSDPQHLLEMMSWYEQDQPARAAQLFDCVIEATIARKKNGAYREAVKLIKAHRPLFDSLGPRVFGAFIVDLRERHRAKRNLMMLLDPFV